MALNKTELREELKKLGVDPEELKSKDYDALNEMYEAKKSEIETLGDVSAIIPKNDDVEILQGEAILPNNKKISSYNEPVEVKTPDTSKVYSGRGYLDNNNDFVPYQEVEVNTAVEPYEIAIALKDYPKIDYNGKIFKLTKGNTYKLPASLKYDLKVNGGVL